MELGSEHVQVQLQNVITAVEADDAATSYTISPKRKMLKCSWRIYNIIYSPSILSVKASPVASTWKIALNISCAYSHCRTVDKLMFPVAYKIMAGSTNPAKHIPMELCQE